MRFYSLLLLSILLFQVFASVRKNPIKCTARCKTSVHKRFTSQNASVTTPQEIKENYRLPRTVIPESYNISIAISLQSFRFNGVVEIYATVVNKIKDISLHCAKIKFLECNVYSSVKEVPIVRVAYNNITEILTLYLGEYIDKLSNIMIVVKYESMLSDDLLGLYRTSYFDVKNERRWMAATHFQPAYARRAFPCFDEPFFKAKFTIHIRRTKEYIALSNMPKVSTIDYPDSSLDTFAETPKMCTYLVAIAVTDFSELSSSTSSISIWARNSLIRNGNFALSYSKSILEVFENLFGVKNPVPKIDMIAFPKFYPIAMENWGLILFRENYLMYDEKENDDFELKNIRSTIGHELAHAWFGNLLSPEWWDDIWLSESFATYFELIGSLLLPDSSSWKNSGFFLINEVRHSMLGDSYDFSSPVSQPCNSPAEISLLFGSSTYNKGGSVLRMIAESFGPEVFYGALQEYIHKHQLSNVRTEYWWEALQNQVNKHKIDLKVSIEDLMKDWIYKPGHPVLLVQVEGNQISLSQERFLFIHHKNNDKWYIPVSYASQNKPHSISAVTTTWMKENMTIEMPEASKQWIVFNNFGAGFYRVNYDNESWYRIIRTLNSENYTDIHEFNRACIIDDLFVLAETKYLNYNVVFDALEYLTYETNYLPFDIALDKLLDLRMKFSAEDEILADQYILNLIKPIYKKVGYFDREGDDKYTIFLRHKLNDVACYLNHPDCISNAKETFAKWKNDPSTMIAKNQQFITYCYAIRNGTAEDWEILNKHYYDNNHLHSRRNMLNALRCTQNHTLLNKLLLETMTKSDSENQIYTEDGIQLFQSIVNSKTDITKFMLQFCVENYKQIIEFFGNEDAVMNLIMSMAERLTSQEKINEFGIYIDDNKKLFQSELIMLYALKHGASRNLMSFKTKYNDIKEWLHSKSSETDI